MFRFSCNLPAGDGDTITFTVLVDDVVDAGQDFVEASVSISDDGSHGDDQTPGDDAATNNTTLDAAPDVVLTVSDGNAAASPGDVVTYTLTYSNDGNQGATGVVITETLPDNTTFNAAASTPGWVHQGGGVYTFDVGNLPAGVSVLCEHGGEHSGGVRFERRRWFRQSWFRGGM